MSIHVGELVRFITFNGPITWEDGTILPSWCLEPDRYFLIKEVADKGLYYRVVIGDHRKGRNGPITYGITGAINVFK